MSVTTKKKHVERELYEDFSLPEDHQLIVKVVKPRGNNLHEVVTPDGEEFLASMPPKFRKHVWIKRGDYVITENIPEGNKVRAEIVRILMKDHIRYIMQNNKWPTEFTEQENDEKSEEDLVKEAERLNVRDSESDESEGDSDDDELLMGNPNRKIVYVETESSDSESEEKSESEEEDN